MRQLKLPLEIEKLIDISDPVYTFCEVMDHIDLSRYFVEKGYKTGRPRCDVQKLLKVILFAFMENGICSLREIEKLCRNDIRYMYLLDGMKTPSFATFGNLIRNELTDSIEQIFEDINSYIFAKDHVDLQHTYIDGTKIEANANRYTWVWKKSCVKNRQKVFDKISLLIDAMNREVLGYLGIKFEKREAYAVDYVSELLTMYKESTGLDETSFVSGRGHRKSIRQKQYEELHEYLERLKSYAYHIETCGEERNSYSKTNSGIALTVDDVIANLKGHEDEYDAMVFACGDAVPVFQQNASKQYNIDLMDVIKNFGEKGKIMIGHCAAAMLFDFTGITEGKKLAVHPLAKPAISKGQATDEDSVVDGNFFTAKEEHYICTMMPQVLEALK